MRNVMKAIVVLAGFGLVSAAVADGHTTSWTLDGENSKIAFGSIKRDTVGEVHTFDGLSGSVLDDGTVNVQIDLTTVETLIDIRNERMKEYVFNGMKTASLDAKIDMSEIAGLSVGDTALVYAEGVLSLVGTEIELETEMFVARLSKTRVLVTTNDMVMLSTADAGLTTGIDKLMELADLPGITRVSPVTFRFIFTADEQKADAASTAPASYVQVAAVSGDPTAGMTVFRKCRACHSLEEGKNGAGPSLHGIFGATAGQVEGFKYSDAMTTSGIIWDTETTAAFVTKPKEYLPGTKMAFAGIRKDEDIANLIAYLTEETAN
ncbi:cytochrome c family protein [Rhodobacteraceae bacterium]|nr:cytochrome c family protein [Paracoccaceae bacterium]